MFYYLNGTITLLDANLAVVDCGGVGYACHTTNYTLARLQLGKSAKLFTYCNIKEDAFDIFGFSTREELNCFERLLGVTGVGPKAALAILSVVSPEQLTLAVMTQDAKTLTMAQGVGKKMAQRILLELKDKIKKNFPEYASASSGEKDIEGEVQTVSGGGKLEDARDALTVLGYSRSEIAAAMKNIDLTLPLEDIIKNALSALMKN